MSTQDTAALVASVNKMTETVVGKMGEIDSHVSNKFNDMDEWKKAAFDSSESIASVARGGFTELDLSHLSKELFYPVLLSGSASDVNRYDITRWYSAKSVDGSLAALFLSFEFTGFTWGGNPISLMVNSCRQRYIQTLGAIGLAGYYSPCVFLRGGFLYGVRANVSKVSCTVYEETGVVYSDPSYPERDVSVGPVGFGVLESKEVALSVDDMVGVARNVSLSNIGGYQAIGPVEESDNV